MATAMVVEIRPHQPISRLAAPSSASMKASALCNASSEMATTSSGGDDLPGVGLSAAMLPPKRFPAGLAWLAAPLIARALITVFGNRGKGFRQEILGLLEPWKMRAHREPHFGDRAGLTRELQRVYAIRTSKKGEKSMERLKGKTAMVVGAGSIGPGWGNGKATAVTFAREGAQVFCVDRNGKAAQETVDIITGEGGKAAAFTADVSRAADVEAMVAACLKTYGRIDVLDNNVGIAEMGSVVEVTEASWDRVFAVNLKSAFFAMKHVIPVMEKQGGGSIINISSIASIRHLGISYVSYGTTKAAMNQMTKTTAVEFARNISGSTPSCPA